MTNITPTSRGIAGYAYGAFAGVASAFIFAFALGHAGSVLFLGAYLATVPLFMAALGAGIGPGLVASVVAAGGLFAMTEFGAFYAIGDTIPAFLLSSIALRPGRNAQAAEGPLLTAFAVYPCLIFLIVYAAMVQHGGDLLASTLAMFNGAEDQVTKLLVARGEKMTLDVTVKIHQIFAFAARVAPALAMGAWLFSTMIALGISQLALQRRQWNLRPAFSLGRLQVPTWVIFAAALTGLAAVFAPPPYDYIGLNLALILGLPFFFVGIAVIHGWAATTRSPTGWLVFFYIVISIVVHLALVVALLGAVDQWVDFRKRFAERNLTKGEK